MSEWEAPAKVNLDLRVAAADATGRHPLHSLVQTIEWCDLLVMQIGDEDHLELAGAFTELPDGGDNLVWKAVEALDLTHRPPLHFRLDKHIAAAAGLGGGSADAAAALRAVAAELSIDDEVVRRAATGVGADVPLFLQGGTLVVEGYGERITPLAGLAGFSLGVAVPPFELPTAEVFARWDALDRPVGDETESGALPPSLRSEGPFRNDLAPAALSLRPELGDWMADLSSRWERAVMMSGSGPACFAYFIDEDEAAAAVGATGENRAAVAAPLRPWGVRRRD